MNNTENPANPYKSFNLWLGILATLFAFYLSAVGPLALKNTTLEFRMGFPFETPKIIYFDTKLAKEKLLQLSEESSDPFEKCFPGLLKVGDHVCVELKKSYYYPTPKPITLPYSENSVPDSHFFTIRADADYGRFSSSWIRIDPDTCLTSVAVNGVDIDAIRKAPIESLCWDKSVEVDLSPALKPGRNKLEINIHDVGVRYGANVKGLFSHGMGTLLACSLITAFISFYFFYISHIASDKRAVVTRYVSVVCISLPVVLTLFFLQAIVEERWSWMANHDEIASHLSQMAVQFFAIPFVFLLWLRAVEREKPIDLKFSPLACAISSIAFTLAQEVTSNLIIFQCFLGFAIVSGLFVLVPFREFLQRVKSNPKPTFAAVIASTCAMNYYLLMHSIWDWMVDYTSKIVLVMLKVFLNDVSTSTGTKDGVRFFTNVISPYFNISVYSGCNGLEGIFLFVFMLSVLFLYDWEFYKNRRFFLRYFLGVIFMFFINALRISMFFMLGYVANNPASWSWLHAFTGAPLTLFHSYVGWVFYLIAFMIFIAF